MYADNIASMVLGNSIIEKLDKVNSIYQKLFEPRTNVKQNEKALKLLHEIFAENDQAVKSVRYDFLTVAEYVFNKYFIKRGKNYYYVFDNSDRLPINGDLLSYMGRVKGLNQKKYTNLTHQQITNLEKSIL